MAWPGGGTGSTETEQEEPIKVGLVTDIGGLTDRGFNALANQGLCTGTLVHPRVVLYAAHCGAGFDEIYGEAAGGRRVKARLDHPDPPTGEDYLVRAQAWMNDNGQSGSSQNTDKVLSIAMFLYHVDKNN